MEPGIIALICAASFGVITALAALIKQLLVSRDKRLNDEALMRGMAQKMSALELIRAQMQDSKRFTQNKEVLHGLKEDLVTLDRNIDRVCHKLEQIAHLPHHRLQIKACQNELTDLRNRRVGLCDRLKEAEQKLIQQEENANAYSATLFREHSFIAGQVYLRDLDFAEHVATQGIRAGTSTFKSLLKAPIEFLMSYFGISSGVSLPQAIVERAHRDDVAAVEADSNQYHLEHPDPHEQGNAPYLVSP